MIHEPSGKPIKYLKGVETKVAVGQLIMHGREHIVGIVAHDKDLMLVILRYADELGGCRAEAEAA